jgi:hypothetical protein
MGIFGRRKQAVAPKVVPPLGSGRRLRSDQGIQACLFNLEQILWSYRQPQYPEMPAYFVPGWTWSSSEAAPDAVVCCADSQDRFLLIAMWNSSERAEIGLFPLGSGDDRLQAMPVIGHWKQKDPSLTSIGTLPADLITLAPPIVPETYCAELIGQRGFPPTEMNLAIGWATICQQFAIKAMQFIASKDRRAADRFVESHGSDYPSHADAQQILNDLADWDFRVLPYMQDIPMRIRALLLSMDHATLWEQLHM